MLTELTNMCMICDGGRILVQNRRDAAWSGITLPGGHIEDGESFAEAVIREVLEETGLIIVEPKLCGVKHWVYNDGSRSISFLYKTDNFSGELISSDEGEVFWADIGDLTKMKLAAGMEETFRVFFDGNIQELAYFKKDRNDLSSDWRYEDWDFQLR